MRYYRMNLNVVDLSKKVGEDQQTSGFGQLKEINSLNGLCRWRHYWKTPYFSDGLLAVGGRRGLEVTLPAVAERVAGAETWPRLFWGRF